MQVNYLKSVKVENGGNLKESSSVSDYLSLLKPRVMSLAVFTSLCGLMIAPGSLHPFLGFISIVCISLGAGASGAINMWYDKDIDSIMDRTKGRALPRGVIFEKNALGFGVLLGLVAIIVLGLAVNYFAAFLLALSILFYVFVYTVWLKRRTHHNIVIGGAAGAFPPVIGWVCVTNELSLYPILLFLTIFFWTPPHFWALSLYKDTEYSKVNIPMLPLVVGHQKTKIQIFIYSLILSVVSLTPYYFGFTSEIFLFVVSCLNLIFIFYSLSLLFEDKNKKKNKAYAPNLFKYSILYLYVYFLILVVEKF